MRNEQREKKAQQAAHFLRKEKFGVIGEQTPIGIILGTGWGDKLSVENRKSIPFDKVPGFQHLSSLTKIKGHAREFFSGTIHSIPVVGISGRIHMNEGPSDPYVLDMIQLQTEVLIKLGAKRLIVTCSAGSLIKAPFKVGDIVVVGSFLSLLAPPMPLLGGQFVSPDSVLSNALKEIALKKNKNNLLGAYTYAMVLGPYFEGIVDKHALKMMGAHMVGMSMLPEACTVALYAAENVEMLGLAFISNDMNEHSHEQNIARAKEAGDYMGQYLTDLIQAM